MTALWSEELEDIETRIIDRQRLIDQFRAEVARDDRRFVEITAELAAFFTVQAAVTRRKADDRP